MKMKIFKAGIIILLILLCFMLTGCSYTNSVDNNVAREYCNFIKVCRNIDVGIGEVDDLYVDTTTGVVYIRLCGADKSGFTPLYNADGTLKKWKGAY